jgi:hypothetical protein
VAVLTVALTFYIFRLSTPVDFIEVIPDSIPDDLCDRLIASFDNHPGVFTGRTGNGVDTDKKISLDLMLDSHEELSGIKNELINHTFKHIIRYFEKFSLALMGAVSVSVQNDAGEPVTLTMSNYADLGRKHQVDIVKYLYRSGAVNIQKYQQNVGGYPHWHSEQYPQLPDNEPLHRVVLYMYYLNDVREGGETEFFYQDQKINPKKGTMVIAPAAFTHSHRGNVPRSENKYIATSWIMFNRAENIYPSA